MNGHPPGRARRAPRSQLSRRTSEEVKRRVCFAYPWAIHGLKPSHLTHDTSPVKRQGGNRTRGRTGESVADRIGHPSAEARLVAEGALRNLRPRSLEDRAIGKGRCAVPTPSAPQRPLARAARARCLLVRASRSPLRRCNPRPASLAPSSHLTLFHLPIALSNPLLPPAAACHIVLGAVVLVSLSC